MTALASAGRTRRTRTQGMPRCQPTFPELRSQRDDMGSGRRSHPDTCRCAVRGTISAANCGAGAPRFCLVCQEAVKAASHNSALTATGSGPGKRKRRSDLLPAHGGPRRCPGSCISVPAFAFRGGLWVRTATEARSFPGVLGCSGTQPGTASRRRRGVVAKELLPGRRTKTRHPRHDSQGCISAVIMVDARLCLRMSQTVCQQRSIRVADGEPTTCYRRCPCAVRVAST